MWQHNEFQREMDVSVLTAPPLTLQAGCPPSASMDRAQPRVLAVMPARSPEMESALCLSAIGYAVSAVSTACEAIELAERLPVAAVVLDLDGWYEAGSEGVLISGFRLLKLLTDATRAHPAAMVVLTRMDFAEVQEVIKLRVQALVNKPAPSARLNEFLRAALERLAGQPPGDYTLTRAVPVASGGV